MLVALCYVAAMDFLNIHTVRVLLDIMPCRPTLLTSFMGQMRCTVCVRKVCIDPAEVSPAGVVVICTIDVRVRTCYIHY